MTKLLSIVIPVYKVEKFIDKCISSLIVSDEKQLQLLDIVVINDGTPDNSAILAKEYEKKYLNSSQVYDQDVCMKKMEEMILEVKVEKEKTAN